MNQKTSKLIRRLALASGGNYRQMKRAHTRTSRSRRANFRNAAAELLRSNVMRAGVTSA